jgi:hypothetical protein
MKLSAYIVRVDSGFSPNPFGRHCTLACCKPTIRRSAKIGDIIIGSGSARYGLSGRLVYAMRVRDVLPYQNYWKTFRYKRPSERTEIRTRGDNIWHLDASGNWRGVRGALHDDYWRERDLRGKNALIATDFYYFGREAIPVDKDFVGLLATTQGHKNTYDIKKINRFWDWISGIASKRGRIGRPSEFSEAGCCAQRTDDEDDDSICE